MLSTTRATRRLNKLHDDDIVENEACEDETTRIEVMFHNISRIDTFLFHVASLPTVKSCRVIWCLDDQTTSEHSQTLTQDALRDAFQRAKRYAAVLGRGRLQAKEVVDGLKISEGSDMLPCGSPREPQSWSHVYKVESSEDLVVPRVSQDEIVHVQPQFVEMRANVKVRFVLKYE